MGNPRGYWTFGDEGANRELARVAQSSHAATWARRVLSKWVELQRRSAKRKA